MSIEGTLKDGIEEITEARRFVGLKRALVGGILAGSVAVGGQLLLEQIYWGGEARRLLEAMLPSARFLASAVITASATILALMLTMLSLTNQAQDKFDSLFYKAIQRIGQLATVSLSSAILLLLLLSVPIQESDSTSVTLYRVIYYVLVTAAAVLAGILVSMVLMLYDAMTSVLKVVSTLELPDVRDPRMEETSDEETEAEEEQSPAAGD